VIRQKRAQLRVLTETFEPDAAYHAFVDEQHWWLEDFALFMALKDAHGGVAWTDWDPGAALRDPSALEEWRTRLAPEIEHYRRQQALFFRQFKALHAAARLAGIQFMGDVPIYVAHDSADVWANRGLFHLDSHGRLLVQAGVPPDYFSATGQLWGNPIYRWDAMRADGYAWWIRRMRSAFGLFDLIRIDHFRGFEAFWEVPADEETAINGRWVKGPGAHFFEAITHALGPLPIAAENLGVITPAVELLREQFEYPGMSILQFAFGTDDQANSFLPHNYSRDLVVYTGTHDNDTTVGWWESTGEGDSTRTAADVAREKEHALEYLDASGEEMNWTLIRAALASVANTAIIPMQDILGLGNEARMNLPGRQSGNWGFRFSWNQLSESMVRRLRELISLYGRKDGTTD
jgi:4-alpha-glucanotransferase